MLLNEVQKQYRRAEAEAEQIKAQQQEIESLRQQLQLQNATMQERLSRLEAVVGRRVNTAQIEPDSGAQ
jgi:outer membrane protein TolC